MTKIDKVVVFVCGDAVVVRFKPTDTLADIRKEAIQRVHYPAEKADTFEIRNDKGAILEPNSSLDAALDVYGQYYRIYLSFKIGTGG